jgi:hypothetical protein
MSKPLKVKAKQKPRLKNKFGAARVKISTPAIRSGDKQNGQHNIRY